MKNLTKLIITSSAVSANQRPNSQMQAHMEHGSFSSGFHYSGCVGAHYSGRAGWPQWRPLDTRDNHLQFSEAVS